MALKPHEQRVVDEQKELDIKIEALVTFLSSRSRPKIPYEELSRLCHQRDAMKEYSSILGERIRNFPVSE